MCVDDSRLVVSRNKHHVEVPWDGRPVPVRIAIVTVVSIGAQIHVREQPIHRLKAVKGGQIKMLAPPRLGVFLTHASQEGIPVGVVRHGMAREMFSSALGGVDISVGESLLFEPVAVHVLNGEVEPTNVAHKGIFGIRFDGVGDDAPLNPVGVGGGGSRELVGTEGERFVESADSAVDGEVGGGQARVQVEAVPRFAVGGTVVAFCGEGLMAAEFEAPLVFSGDVGASLASVVESDVVVDDTVNHECSEKAFAVVGAVPLTFGYVVTVREEVVRRERGEKVRCEREGVAFARLNGAQKGWEPVVDQPCAVGAGIVFSREGTDETVCRDRADAVTNEASVGLDICGDGHGEAVVAGGWVAVASFIVHGQRVPALVEGWV